MERTHGSRIDLFALAMLFVSIVLVVLALIGIALRDTNALVILPPLALGFKAILDLEKD